MTGFGILAMAWPFLMIGLAVTCVPAFHRLLDRREQQHHAAE
ncbi:MAG: hypothetical protein ACXWKC_09855 [Xanthobacteraceae bacterium]